MASLKPGLHKNGGARAPGTDCLQMCLFTPKYGTPDYFLKFLCHVTLVFRLDSILVMIAIMLKDLMPNVHILDWLISSKTS